VAQLSTLGHSDFMRPKDNRFSMACLTTAFLIIGSVHFIASLIALTHGTTVSFWGYKKIQVSPWFTLILGSVFLTVAIVMIWKAYKNRDKHPF
jgi:hypothetical protein